MGVFVVDREFLPVGVSATDRTLMSVFVKQAGVVVNQFNLIEQSASRQEADRFWTSEAVCILPDLYAG